MATTIVTNLYPPIMPDVIPAFIRTESCKIHFALSSYNSLNDIKNVQLTLTNQKTNQSALDSVKYPSNIKIIDKANIQIQDTEDNYKYYIELPASDLINNIFLLNQFYKIQLRFTSIQAEDIESEGRGIATWLTNNVDYFSEWSTVCLLKGIEQPLFSIKNFTETDINILYFPLTNIAGRMYFSNSRETEYLKSYNIQIYETDISSDNLAIDSGQVYTNEYNPNEINYEINYDLNTNVVYFLVLNYTTNNLYTNTINYRFKIQETQNYILDAHTSFQIDEENGRIKISVLPITNKDLIIKRASSKTNFIQWETLKTIPYSLSPETVFVWYDTSIESGIWYKYRIQQVGQAGKLIDSEQPLMCVFEDMFLTTGEKQLKIQFNPALSNFKYNVTESQQTTLGSQFPYIKRNGNNYFRSFSIGGLITSLIDTADWYNAQYSENDTSSFNFIEPFSSKTQIYGNAESLYNQYNINNNIDYRQDYIYEKEFRKKVYDFLYKNNIKLFRSTTQGNILVKIMDVNFQPVEQLGRCLYSFTANAVEIAENNAENYKKYNIINQQHHTLQPVDTVLFTDSLQSDIVVDGTTDAQALLNKKWYDIFVTLNLEDLSFYKLLITCMVNGVASTQELSCRYLLVRENNTYATRFGNDELFQYFDMEGDTETDYLLVKTNSEKTITITTTDTITLIKRDMPTKEEN